MSTPRIYIACLAAYTNGTLHGKWIDANQDPEGLNEEILAISKTSPIEDAEEWAIHDYEGFESIPLGEYEPLGKVSTLARLIEEHGTPFATWYTNMDGHHVELGELEESFQDSYLGEWDSEEAFAENLLEDTGQLGEIPENLRYYFDFEKFARDLRIGGDYTFVRHEGKTYVFSNH